MKRRWWYRGVSIDQFFIGLYRGLTIPGGWGIYYFVTKKSSKVPGDHGESGEAGDLGESGLSKGLRNDFRDTSLVSVKS